MSVTIHNFIITVPIYDGTKGNLNMTRLGNLSQDLQEFDGDLVNTACLVGFTANTWTSTKSPDRQLSCNVQWVVVLATN